MTKSYLITIGLLFCSNLQSFAQTLIKEMDNADDTRFIPGQYMKNGEAAIYFSSDEYGYSEGSASYEAEIFDFDLNPLKSFHFQTLHPYTVTERRATNGTKELTKVISMIRNELHGMPDVSDMEARKNAFISWFFDANKYSDPSITIEALAAGCRIQGTTVYITLPKNNEYYIQYAEYLKSIEVYFDESDLYGYNYTYSTVVPIYSGEWESETNYKTPVSNFCTPRCNDVAKMNHWNGGVYLPFSQTFFNEDEKFEYVRYIAEIAEGGYTVDYIYSEEYSDPLRYLFGITATDRDGDGEDDYSNKIFGIHYKGFEVVNEDGEVLYSFPMPDKCEYISIEFFKSDDNILAQASFYWLNENNNYMRTIRFYRIDKTTGIADIIREENHLSAYPNPVSKGSSVEIKLPDGHHHSRNVSVTSLGGSTVFTLHVDPEANVISIPTGSLSAGTYIISLSEEGRTADYCKIIVR